MDKSAARTTAAGLRAMAIAEQAKAASFGVLSDQELRERLPICACDVAEQHEPEQIVKAIGLVDVAVRRRMGVWRAVLSDHRQLSGAVRAMREAAGDIIGRARSASTGTQGISLEDWARTQGRPAPEWAVTSSRRFIGC